MYIVYRSNDTIRNYDRSSATAQRLCKRAMSVEILSTATSLHGILFLSVAVSTIERQCSR